MRFMDCLKRQGEHQPALRAHLGLQIAGGGKCSTCPGNLCNRGHDRWGCLQTGFSGRPALGRGVGGSRQAGGGEAFALGHQAASSAALRISRAQVPIRSFLNSA